jgi:hypothetical protein
MGLRKGHGREEGGEPRTFEQIKKKTSPCGEEKRRK